MARLTDLNAQVLGISVNDPELNKEFAERNLLPYPILSDSNHDVIRQYGLEQPISVGDTQYVLAKHSIFIVNQEGIIRYVWLSTDPLVEPNYDEVQQALKGIT
jgi:peroxiredoxin